MNTPSPRTVLISGASRGIGRAIAERLLADGHRLSLGLRDPAALKASAQPSLLLHRYDAEDPASAVFSQPELATVGLSEEQAIERCGADSVTIHRARFRPMSQALPARDPKVLLKLVVETASGKVLGCHMVGEHAAEIIQMAAIAIGMGATKADFDRTMALHPSVAEEFVTMPN